MGCADEPARDFYSQSELSEALDMLSAGHRIVYEYDIPVDAYRAPGPSHETGTRKSWFCVDDIVDGLFPEYHFCI